jgi:hypothetical protein
METPPSAPLSKAPTLLANIRLDWKSLLVANVLAKKVHSLGTNTIFVTLIGGINLTKTFILLRMLPQRKLECKSL